MHKINVDPILKWDNGLSPPELGGGQGWSEEALIYTY